MTVEQCQRLESSWEIIRDYKNVIKTLESDLKKLAETTDLRFFNARNCEGTVSIAHESDLFPKMREAADRLIRERIAVIRKRIEAFPANYVEVGSKTNPAPANG
jgi:hypothetical protein